MIPKGMGWRRDGLDRRDVRYAAPRAVTAALPPSVDLSIGGHMPPVEDQGQLGACTTFAILAALRYAMLCQGEYDVPLSHLYLYYNERAMEGTIASDAGAEIRDGIKAVAAQGACPETEWPYDISTYRQKPPDACYTDAAKHVALQYQSVAQTLTEMQGCLAEGFPFVVGISLYASFGSDAVAQSGVAPMPQSGEAPLGGHAILVCGYNTQAQTFRCRNSWGSAWGRAGYFTLPMAYLLDANLAADFWTIRLAS